MQFKALTAILVAVFASGLLSTAHVKALSQTKSNIKQTSTVKTTAAVVTQPQPISATVVSGDTLSSIAAKNGTTYIRLFDANSNITNPDQIIPGEVVVIPDASQQLPDRYGQFVQAQQASSVASQSSVSTQSSTPVAATMAVTTTPASDVWTELAACEAGGNWSANTGNGFYGGLQFTLSSWQAMGGTGLPSNASQAEQIAIGQKLQAEQGWGAWPVCSAKIGL